jgi:methyl-accepting chemotaxis protein
MEREVQERFERIEVNLERVSERMNTISERVDTITERVDRITDRVDRITDRIDRITEAHLELESAQKNTTLTIDRFVEESKIRGREIDERIANLTILVDHLIKKDLGPQ